MLSLNPAKYLRFGRKLVRLNQQVNGRARLPFIQQARETRELLRCNLLEPEEYYLYELYDPSVPWEEKKNYIGRRAFVLLDRAMNPHKEVGLLNKLVFKIYAERFGISVPKMYGVFDPAFGFTADGQPLKDKADLGRLLASIDDDFLVKPIGADKGMGIQLCRWEEPGTVNSVGRGRFNLDQFYEQLANSHFNLQEHVSDSYVIEERVRQHPFLDRYTSSCTQTLRIITFITRDRRIVPIAAVQKIAVSGVPVDNVGESGMATQVDDTGVMGPAFRLESVGTTRFDKHPETGAAITGEQLPKFQEAIDLAIRAQAAVPQMRNLAWDIALTQDGATIIEGNAYWGWEGMQRNCHRGLMRGALGEELRELIAASSRGTPTST